MKKLFAILLCAVMLGALCVPASAAADTETGLAVHLTFDVDGTDAKGVANFADIDASRFVEGKFGKALKFDGAGTGVTTTIAADKTVSCTNGLTISLWVRIDGAPADNSLIGWNGAWAHMFIQKGGNLGMHTNHVNAQGVEGGNCPYAWNSRADLVPEDKVQMIDSEDNLGKWNHITVVSDYANKTVTYYLNGIAYNGSASGNFDAEQAAELEFWIQDVNTEMTLGSWGPGNIAATGFVGLMDDVRIYSRALTAEDVAALYNPTTGDDTTGDDNADTFDALTVVALVALTSTAGVVVSKKRR